MRLDVNLATHPYQILIERGSLSRVGEWLRALWSPKKVVIITDNRVASFYLGQVQVSLESAGFDVGVFAFPDGESQKNLETVNQIYHYLATFGLTRSDGILALGGGVVGDLAGFVASTFMRGIPFVHVPTSLTAQVDSSIGGKTGVNTPFAKNMVGTFAQPDGVLIDPDTLYTLGQRELIEGMGEVIKYGLIADQDLWSLLNRMSGSSVSILDNADELICRSCLVKCQFVVEDEFDNGNRLFLNFGHTIGHALEATAGYGQLMHGEAVAIGMIQMSRVAEQKGLIETGLTEKIYQMCMKFGLPTAYQTDLSESLYQAILHDKKARGHRIKLVLVPKIGEAMIYQVPIEEIKEFLEYKA